MKTFSYKARVLAVAILACFVAFFAAGDTLLFFLPHGMRWPLFVLAMVIAGLYLVAMAQAELEASKGADSNERKN